MMSKWDWLENPPIRPNRAFMLRVGLKTLLLFALLNLLFALLNPMQALGRISLYNLVFPGRERLPYGENSAQSYNLSLFNLPAMFESHLISQAKADDEFRVIILGDSSVWGWLLEVEDTLSAQINAAQLSTDEGQRIVAYNLGYPIMSLTKDLMLLDYAKRYEPDLIVWAFTLESFPREKQLFPPIVQNNAETVRELISAYALALDPADPRLVDAEFIDQTIVGRRRELADLLRLQLLGTSWRATGIDQFIPDDYTPTARDLSESLTWEGIAEPRALTETDLAFDVLRAGVERAAAVPVLLVNEPMLISDGANSELRYNAFFPRWAYDAYHELLLERVAENGWPLLDLWDRVPAAEFTDSPVHMSAEGTRLMAESLLPLILEMADQ